MNFEMMPTERLVLRRLTDDDYNYIFANYPEAEIRSVLGLFTDAEYARELEKYRGGYIKYNSRFIMFQLLDKVDGTILGRCALHKWSQQHFRAELGYDMREEYRRRGLMSEAVKAVLRYGFTTMGLNRVEAMTRPDNTPSVKIIENSGFTREGYLRRDYFDGTNFTDSIVFGLLKEEWERGV